MKKAKTKAFLLFLAVAGLLLVFVVPMLPSGSTYQNQYEVRTSVDAVRLAGPGFYTSDNVNTKGRKLSGDFGTPMITMDGDADWNGGHPNMHVEVGDINTFSGGWSTGAAEKQVLDYGTDLVDPDAGLWQDWTKETYTFDVLVKHNGGSEWFSEDSGSIKSETTFPDDRYGPGSLDVWTVYVRFEISPWTEWRANVAAIGAYVMQAKIVKIRWAIGNYECTAQNSDPTLWTPGSQGAQIEAAAKAIQKWSYFKLPEFRLTSVGQVPMYDTIPNPLPMAQVPSWEPGVVGPRPESKPYVYLTLSGESLPGAHCQKNMWDGVQEGKFADVSTAVIYTVAVDVVRTRNWVPEHGEDPEKQFPVDVTPVSWWRPLIQYADWWNAQPLLMKGIIVLIILAIIAFLLMPLLIVITQAAGAGAQAKAMSRHNKELQDIMRLQMRSQRSQRRPAQRASPSSQAGRKPKKKKWGIF